MLRNKDCSHAHPSPNTRSRHKHPPTRRLLRHFKTRRRLSCARRSQRMSQRNPSSICIHLVLANLEMLDGHDILNGKRLVDPVEIYGVKGEMSGLEDAGDGKCWTDTHDRGRDADDKRGDQLAEDGEA
jgi:hypothetical protein